jgi:DNA repair photolyase
MGFRRFPASGKKKQQPNACCTIDTIKEWDCGCSWGCETCYVSARCDVCHQMFGWVMLVSIVGEAAAEVIRRQNTVGLPVEGKK